MVNEGCLVMQVRVSQLIQVVSRSSSLPGIEASLQMEIFFLTINILYKRGNLCFIFRQLWGGKQLFLLLLVLSYL